ncbi:MAG: aminopeptidase P family protein [Muribaculaceae bacterium]|nr:aminopeptidase P family protein [Muribaculaceae bacterium]
MDNIIKQRIKTLQTLIAQQNIDAYIIPQNDPHQSEYLAKHWQTRKFFSGFTGSAGTLVVTQNKALLWTDNRYFLQAETQLEGSDIQLMKDGLPSTPSINSWLSDNISKDGKIGVNGWLISAMAFQEMKARMDSKNISIITDFDPVNQIWTDRPPLPKDKAFVHDVKYAGETAVSKINRIIQDLASKEVTAYFVSALDEIAWTLNLRGTDVHCNPVATCFLYISPAQSIIFIDNDKLTDEVLQNLKEANVSVLPYENTRDFLKQLDEKERVLVDPARTACIVLQTLGIRAVEGDGPIQLMKAIKNPTQIQGFRNAMRRDGAALARGFREIERRMAQNIPTTEIDVADILRNERSKEELFFDISFDTIAGYASNGAIIHYSATPQTNTLLKPEGLLLVDSGAQFLDGTTDITRTISLGTPTPEEKRDFTLVLKGMIALDMAVFPAGTRGVQLDILAHQYLWRAGQSYLHGTGHGIGHFLNVHEGPQTIRNNNNLTPIHVGMITSDEPGLYKPGVHGVRCENCILAVPATIDGADDFEYIKFETMTLFPFDLNLIDTTLLNDDEVEWINAYHKRVFDILSPGLDTETKEWLKIKTQQISK